jgi:hypothetical protein
MSHYIKTKFQIGQDIYSIEKDEIKKITVESISISTDKRIFYLSKNNTFCESQSFANKEEAEDFMSKSYRVPFLTGDFAWEGNLQGVKRVEVRNFSCFWFNEDLKKPYNRKIHTDACLNSATTCETRLEAVEQLLKMLKQNEDNLNQLLKNK